LLIGQPGADAFRSLDELVDPSDLRIRCWINDELRLDCSTGEFVMSAVQFVALLSSFMTLLAFVSPYICLAAYGMLAVYFARGPSARALLAAQEATSESEDAS
jgi:hypothetical protein